MQFKNGSGSLTDFFSNHWNWGQTLGVTAAGAAMGFVVGPASFYGFASTATTEIGAGLMTGTLTGAAAVSGQAIQALVEMGAEAVETVSNAWNTSDANFYFDSQTGASGWY